MGGGEERIISCDLAKAYLFLITFTQNMFDNLHVQIRINQQTCVRTQMLWLPWSRGVNPANFVVEAKVATSSHQKFTFNFSGEFSSWWAERVNNHMVTSAHCWRYSREIQSIMFVWSATILTTFGNATGATDRNPEDVQVL